MILGLGGELLAVSPQLGFCLLLSLLRWGVGGRKRGSLRGGSTFRWRAAVGWCSFTRRSS
eukprot:COSAG02_NODE_1597_length_11762_cov_4.644002_9_plen_60_part_00